MERLYEVFVEARTFVSRGIYDFASSLPEALFHVYSALVVAVMLPFCSYGSWGGGGGVGRFGLGPLLKLPVLGGSECKSFRA